MYCAETLLDAFPDARVIQIIRDGRDAVAGMLADPGVLAWFKPGFVDIGSGVPAPAARPGVRGGPGRLAGLSATGKCAMRWRGTVRQMARLRARLPAEQLITFRYEEVIRQPGDAAAAISDFLATAVLALEPPALGRPVAGRAGVLAALAAAGPDRARSRRSPARNCAASATEPARGVTPGTPAHSRARRGHALRRTPPPPADPAQDAFAGSWRANCVWYSSAYRPPAASSSACVPRSATRPSSMTRIWSASRMVDSRCAMTSEVRPVSAVLSAAARRPRTRSPGARSPRPAPPPRAP